MSIAYIVLLWVFLNIMILVGQEIALFAQTTEEGEELSLPIKILDAQFWATFQWLFVIPAHRVGFLFLTVPQLALSSYVFNFLGRIVSNAFWLKLPTTPDDYLGMSLVLVGMYISKYLVFG
jgi:uncharacterized protein (DUF486 family)